MKKLIAYAPELLFFALLIWGLCKEQVTIDDSKQELTEINID